MRIAVVMAGYPRTYKICFSKFLENFIFGENYSIDFFLHFYDSELNQDILETYRPADWICEKEYYSCEKYRNLSYRNPEFGYIEKYKYNIYSQFKNNLLAFSLIPDDTYDVVVKTRYDLLLNQKFDFSKLNMDDFNIPSGEDYEGLNDRFCISSYNNMKFYFNFFKKIDFINQYREKFHPESMLKNYFAYTGTKVNRFICDTNNILR